MSTSRELTIIWKLTATVYDDRALGMAMAAVLAKIAAGEVNIPPGMEGEVTVTADRKNPGEAGITMSEPLKTTVTVTNSFVNIVRENGVVVEVKGSPDVEEAAKAQHMGQPVQTVETLH